MNNDPGLGGFPLPDGSSTKAEAPPLWRGQEFRGLQLPDSLFPNKVALTGTRIRTSASLSGDTILAMKVGLLPGLPQAELGFRGLSLVHQTPWPEMCPPICASLFPDIKDL